jgi:hypothetical protein
MTYEHLSFVDGSPELRGKKRELRTAQCRAHAARVTHSRAKTGLPSRLPRKVVLTLTLDPPDLSCPDSTTKGDESPEQQPSVALERRTPIPASALSQEADPFAILEPFGLPEYVHALMKFGMSALLLWPACSVLTTSQPVDSNGPIPLDTPYAMLQLS